MNKNWFDKLFIDDVKTILPKKPNTVIPDGYIKPEGTKEITENGVFPIAEFENVDVNVAGGSGGDSIVVDVDELPTENVDDSKIYRITEEVNICEIYCKNSYCSNDALPLSEFIKIVNGDQYKDATVNYHIVESAPSIETMLMSDYDTKTFEVYIALDTGLAYMTDSLGEAVLDAVDYLAFFYPDNCRGIINSLDEITDEDYCYYTLISKKDVISYGVANASIDTTVSKYNGVKWCELAEGIVDVTELPKTGIKSANAYRLSTSNNIYVYNDYDGQAYTLQAYLDFMTGGGSVAKIYFVDELPEQMEQITFNKWHVPEYAPVYVINSTGIGYVSETGNNTDAVVFSGVCIHPEMYAPAQGWVDSIDQVNAAGIYCIQGTANISMHTYSDNWTNYVREERVTAVQQEKDALQLKYDIASICITDESLIEFIEVSTIERTASNTLKLKKITDTSIDSITIPQGIKEISGYAFQDCTSLTEIIVPEGVTTVNYAAFKDCTSLKRVKFPSTLDSYTFNYGDPFVGCTAMQTIDFTNAVKVPNGYDNANFLKDIPSTCKIIVPDALYDSWCNYAGWSDHKSKIVKASQVS